jgi:hypothetical protein
MHKGVRGSCPMLLKRVMREIGVYVRPKEEGRSCGRAGVFFNVQERIGSSCWKQLSR